MACNDDALEFVSTHQTALQKRYILEEFDKNTHTALLDKQKTIEFAKQAGVPTPANWPIETMEELEALRSKIPIPAIVKPLNSIEFRRKIGRKLLIATDNFDQLLDHAARAFAANQKFMIVELIPGGDDKLCSYFTYLTPNGQFLFDYTKSVIRRYPIGYGGGSCHVTRWQPDAMEMGRKFLKSIDYHGMANIEFKRHGDQLKIIEINTRFAASHELITRSGAPIDLIVYCHLTQQAIPTFDSYEQDLYLWAPVADTLAFLQLNRQKKMAFSNWIRDVFSHKLVFPIFQISDPLPFLKAIGTLVAKLQKLLYTRLKSRLSPSKSNKRNRGPA